MVKQILLAGPRGFCAGVDRAIETVERALAVYGAPVYVRHEIVHNQYVCDDLRSKGAVFVEDTSDVPKGSVLVFSAHGVSPSVVTASQGYRIVDATCPLVTKVHLEAKKYHADGYSIVLIGHKGHQEVIGTMGEAPMVLVENVDDIANLKLDGKIVYLTQTTLSVDDTNEIILALKAKYPHIVGPPKEDICYATTNRQSAIKSLARQCDLVLVVGSHNSSNSNRLVDTARSGGVPSYLVPDASHVREEWLTAETIGISSGASVPEILVQEVVARICSFAGEIPVSEHQVIEERMHFSLPMAVLKKS